MVHLLPSPHELMKIHQEQMFHAEASLELPEDIP